MADEESRKNELFARLEAREAVRQEGVAKRKGDASQQQDIEVFWEAFNAASSELTKAIDSGRPLQEAGEHLQVMRELVNEATIVLPPYELRSAEQTMSSMEAKIAEVQESNAPKKSFKFARKEKKKKDKKCKKAAASKASVVVAEGSSVEDLSGATVRKGPAELAGDDYTVQRMEGCTVYLCSSMTALRLVKLKNCKVYGGPVGGSCFIDECDDCVFMLSCHQLRMHTSKGCDLYLDVTSKPIIEHCEGIRVAPYAFSYPELEKDRQVAALEGESRWSEVNDFLWLKTQSSPNWCILPEAERVSSTSGEQV